MKLLSRFVTDRSGATAIEYGLLAGLMAVAVLTAIGAFSPKFTAAFGAMGDAIGNRAAKI